MKKIFVLMTLLLLTMQSVYADPAVGNGATINGTTPKLTGVQLGPVNGTVGSGDALLNLTSSTTQLRPASSTQPFTIYNAAGSIANLALNDSGQLTVYGDTSIGTNFNMNGTAALSAVGSTLYIKAPSNFQFQVPSGTSVSNINSSGTYGVGNSTYGSTSATINGGTTSALTLSGSSTAILTFPNNAGQNLIDMYGGSNFGAPTFTTHSIGEKIAYFDDLSSTQVDYATGVAGGQLWNSIPKNATTNSFGWYGGTNQIATLDGTGNFSINGNFISGAISIENSNVPTGGNLAIGTLNSSTVYGIELGNSLSTSYGTNISTNSQVVSTVTGSLFALSIPGASAQLSIDGSGNEGISGSFKTGSSVYGPTSESVNGTSSATGYTATSGNFTAGSSTYGPTSESVNGTSSASGGYTAGSSNYGATSASVAGNITSNTSGNFVTGSSSYGATSAVINGGLTIGGSSTNNNLNINSGNSVYLNGGSPGSFITGSSTYGPTGTTVNGPVNATNGVFSGNLTVANPIYQSPASPTNNVTNTTNQFSNSLAVFGSSNSAVSDIYATAANYYNNGSSPSYIGTALAQYGSSATGTTSGLSNAGLGEILFQNTTNGIIVTNGSPLTIAPGYNTSPITFDASGNISMSPSGTATSSTTHYNSTAHKFSSSDWSGSAAVTNTGSIYMQDYGNPGNTYELFSPPSGYTLAGIGIANGANPFIMGLTSAGLSGWIPGGTNGYAWYNNAGTVAEMTLSDTGLMALTTPLPVTSGGTGGKIGPGTALTAATSAINTTETILATDPLGTASLAAGTTFDIKLFGTCTSTASNTSTFTLRFGTTGTTSDASIGTITFTSATSGTAVAFSLDTMLTIRTIGSSATSAAYGTLVNGASTGTGTGISTVSAGAAAYATSSFNSSITSGILSISYKSSATTTTSTFQNAIIIANHY